MLTDGSIKYDENDIAGYITKIIDECEDDRWSVSRDAKNENSVSQGENGVLTRIQKSSGYSPEA